ncbi:MAG TPA: hypothetical protein VJR23_00935 [Candidatus Acidoferrales bacterium]|nr:hypothetical protein [Candidatus Acidoferrales bacterium]
MNPSDIHEQVGRVLQSRTFASKIQLRKLLEILHKNIDSQAELRPTGVIQELWPEEVRTKRPADVATEMNRLRRALEDYYESEGAGDPVVICLPNRSAAGANGAQEKRWIVARPRDAKEAAEDHPPAPLASAARRRRLFAYAGIAGMVILAASFVGFRALEERGEPKSGRMEGTALVILDGEGKELWRKTFAGGFGPDTYYAKGLESRIWFEDLEGKGHTSVLFSYLPAASTQPHSSTLICYSNRGKERWRWTPGRALPENGGSNATYKAHALGIVKARRERPARIVVASDMDPWWGGPSQVAELDANGRLISEYWHSGGFDDMVVADLEGNGNEEIIATGVAYGYNYEATLVVLDPDRVTGASKEEKPEYQIHGMEDAQEKMRLLFPRSDLNLGSFDHNVAMQPVVEGGDLRITVDECLAPIGCPIEYEFNKEFELTGAHPVNSEFEAAHDRLYKNGKSAHRFGTAEQAEFLRVRCVRGCETGFVPVEEKFDPVESFEGGWTTRKNPNGVWSYGYSEGFTEPITLYDRTVQNGINGQNAEYWLSSVVNDRTSPAAQFNNGPAYNDGNVDFLKDEFVLVAGVHKEYSDLIFTAPDSGDYSIAGSFRGAQYAVGTVVGVVTDGTTVFRSKVAAVEQVAPFRVTSKLTAGERVVFVVGPGEGTQNTGVSATITKACAPTDEPSFTPSGEITCSGGKAPLRGAQEAQQWARETEKKR